MGLAVLMNLSNEFFDLFEFFVGLVELMDLGYELGSLAFLYFADYGSFEKSVEVVEFYHIAELLLLWGHAVA